VRSGHWGRLSPTTFGLLGDPRPTSTGHRRSCGSLDGSVRRRPANLTSGRGTSVPWRSSPPTVSAEPAAVASRGVDLRAQPTRSAPGLGVARRWPVGRPLPAAMTEEKRSPAFQAQRWGADVELSGRVALRTAPRRRRCARCSRRTETRNCGLPLLAPVVPAADRQPDADSTATRHRLPLPCTCDVEVDTATGQAPFTRYCRA